MSGPVLRKTLAGVFNALLEREVGPEDRMI